MYAESGTGPLFNIVGSCGFFFWAKTQHILWNCLQLLFLVFNTGMAERITIVCILLFSIFRRQQKVVSVASKSRACRINLRCNGNESSFSWIKMLVIPPIQNMGPTETVCDTLKFISHVTERIFISDCVHIRNWPTNPKICCIMHN